MEIRIVGDDILRQKAKPVKKVTKELRQTLDEMADTMYAAKGVGLAAPQVGISKRVLIADVGDGLIELVNPSIVFREGRQNGLEGCLSIPDIVGEVERFEHVRVTGWNRDGHQVWVEATGLLSRCLQHEIDHLDGILFTDLAMRIIPSEDVREDEMVLD